MAYSRINWLDRVVQFVRRYRDQSNNQYTFTPDEGVISQAGTPFSAANMNAMDLALYLTNNTFTTAGSANAYTLTISGISALTDLIGVPLKIKTNFANTGACTLNVNGYGAKDIRMDVSVAMISGDILSGQIVILVWDGTYFQFMGEAAGTVTTGRTQTLTNKTLTSPTLTTPKFQTGGAIVDANSNELIKFPATVASAVNEVTISNAVAGQDPSIAATGNDTDIDLNLVSKGAGKVLANGSQVALNSDLTTHTAIIINSGGSGVHGIRMNGSKLEYYDGTNWLPAISSNNIVFGDGSDGDFNSTGNTVWSLAADDTYYVGKRFRNFTLNTGHTLSIDKRNLGMIIRCTGNCVINGTIDQNNKGANITRNTGGTVWVNYGRIDQLVYPGTPTVDQWTVPAGGSGGAGGAGGSLSNGTSSGGSNCAFGASSGGGGTGGANVLGMTGGAGGNGGGSLGTAGGAGGAGSNNTPGAIPGNGGTGGGGGLVIILVQGSLTIGATGSIQCKGGNGANGQDMANGSSGGGGGGGAGGGVVYLGYVGTYTNNGSILVTAGTAGAGGISTGYPARNGGAGVAGTIGSITTKQLA